MSQMFPEPTPSETPANPPVTPAGVPGRPAGAPAWLDRKQIALNWMEKGQAITAELLYNLGSWIFGGLIVASLMLLQDLISLGSADHATLIAGLAIAIAFPFNLAGLGIIRYSNALNRASEEARQILAENASLDAETVEKLTRDNEAVLPGKRKAMDFTVSLALYLSVFFTIIGLSSALWRISWVVTILFLLSSAFGVLLTLRVIRYS